MVHEIRIYYEGDRLLKSGFDKFLEALKQRARGNRCQFRLVSTGATSERDFSDALRSHPDAWNILLKDSEGPDSGNLSAALCRQYGIDHSHSDSIFWMVEMMESWFHADKDALATFYGDGFHRNALKPNPNVEEIPKKDLEDGLKAATRRSQKGEYHKTSHAPKLLALINPGRVREAAPNCDRLFQAVLTKLA